MIAALPLVYLALACTTVVPPPGTPAVAATATTPAHPAQRPAWDFLGACTALNEAGVQQHPSLNPVKK